MNELLPLNDGLPSRCEVYGHHWRATNQPGRFLCVNCRHIGYCAGCLLTIPANVLRMTCKQHQEQEVARE